jgi:hypothetical protein
VQNQHVLSAGVSWRIMGYISKVGLKNRNCSMMNRTIRVGDEPQLLNNEKHDSVVLGHKP